MAQENEKAARWYQEKKWVVSAGLICGVGLGLILLEPVIDDVVPVLFTESASEPDLAAPDSADAAPVGDGSDTTETTAAARADNGDQSSTTEASSEDPKGTQPQGPYELLIFGTEDVSVDEMTLKVVTAELNLYPVDKDKLRAALDLELEQYRGDANGTPTFQQQWLASDKIRNAEIQGIIWGLNALI